MSTYSFKIEADDVYPGKWMVIIRNPVGIIHGIPFRRADKELAEKVLLPLKHSFERGVCAAKEACKIDIEARLAK